MAEIKQRLKPAVQEDLSSKLDKPDQGTSLALLIRALRADLGFFEIVAPCDDLTDEEISSSRQATPTRRRVNRT